MRECACAALFFGAEVRYFRRKKAFRRVNRNAFVFVA